MQNCDAFILIVDNLLFKVWLWVSFLLSASPWQ